MTYSRGWGINSSLFLLYVKTVGANEVNMNKRISVNGLGVSVHKLFIYPMIIMEKSSYNKSVRKSNIKS